MMKPQHEPGFVMRSVSIDLFLMWAWKPFKCLFAEVFGQSHWLWGLRRTSSESSRIQPANREQAAGGEPAWSNQSPGWLWPSRAAVAHGLIRRWLSGGGHFSTLIAAAERRKTSWNLQENNLRLTLTFHHFSFKTGTTLWRRGWFRVWNHWKDWTLWQWGVLHYIMQPAHL